MVRINGNFLLTFSPLPKYLVLMKRPLPRTNSSMCMVGVPSGASALQGHWMLPPNSSIRLKLTPVKVGVKAAISSMISRGCL
ncbi:hypothetical protein D3C81_1743990 [compost metagenome]